MLIWFMIPEPTDEELKVMDEQIRPSHPKDLIVWPDGQIGQRRNVDPADLEASGPYNVLPYDSKEWHRAMECDL
jgi:hypothetical protein